jgi:Tfp pilus assembly protein PilV
MRLKNLSGEGLIESLICMLLIFGSIIALMSFQSNIAYNDDVSAQTTDAVMFAINELENLRDFQVLNTTPGYTAYTSIVSSSGSSTGMNTTYTLVWTVTANTNPTYKNINVTVSWTDRRSVSHTVKMSTDVAGIDPSYSSSVM